MFIVLASFSHRSLAESHASSISFSVAVVGPAPTAAAAFPLGAGLSQKN